MIRNVTDKISSTYSQNPSNAENDFRNRLSHLQNLSNSSAQTSSIKEAVLLSVSDVFGDDEDILTAEKMNMIIAADTKIEHHRIIVLQQIAAEAIAHYREELRFDKRFVAAEQAILSHSYQL